jgi:S-adenosylmethionine-dependent methyltransferase
LINTDANDRNFDDLADKFERKVYGGLKGDIRLAVIWRDLLSLVPQISYSSHLRILDIGAGLGQLGVRLAALGHRVDYNDISQKMMTKAKQLASHHSVADKMGWYQCAYQELRQQVQGQYDLVLCHALAEWLSNPTALVPELKTFLADNGKLSLTFYNYHGLVYRNLMRGNFRVLEGGFEPDANSLTPRHPLAPDTMLTSIRDAGLQIQQSSGIRVFYDYITSVRGGHADSQSVVDMELKYSQQAPYKWLGRYIHLIASAN